MTNDRRTKRTVRPSSCAVCSHPARAEIERARVAGVSIDALAAKYSTSRDSIWRHMHNSAHVSPARLAELTAKVTVPIIVEKEGQIEDQLAVIRNGWFNQYVVAKEAGDVALAATATSKFNESAMTSHRVLDGMRRTSGITINHQVNNNFASSPAALAIVDVVLDHLRDLPERRTAIAAAIRALNDAPLPKTNGSRFVAEPVTIEGKTIENELADVD